jgi:hypothetical protein
MGLTDLHLNLLRPHQIAPAKRLYELLSAGKNCVDLSDGGTGKTYVATAVASALQRPTLVVVPRAGISAWKTAAALFHDGFSVLNYEMLRIGRTPYGWWDNTPEPGEERKTYLVCQNCQQVVDPVNPRPCYTHPQGIHCVDTKKKPWRYGQFHFAREVRLIIFDEGHRCGALDSLNSDMMISAKRDGIPTLVITATAACSPLQLRALGFVLGLHSMTDYYTWAGRYKCRRDPRFHGFKWFAGQDEQREIMADIRSQIIPARGVRVTTDQIPGFPKCNISAELYDLEDPERVNKLYSSMSKALGDLKSKSDGDISEDHPLTKILRARQKIELLKVPIAVELAQDYRAKGCSVAIFANFRQTLEELSARLKCKLIVDGAPDGIKNRDRYIAQFQSNAEGTILLNCEAGGVALSLHDLQGGHPRVGLVFPNFSATSMKQVFWRLAREGGKTPAHYRVLFAAGTVETKVHRALTSKINCLDALNDADMKPEMLHLLPTELPDIG